MTLRACEGGTELRVLVQPRAARTAVAGVHDDQIKIRIAAPPVDGAANDALTRFLAKQLGLARSAVEIVAGHTGRRKTVRVTGPAPAEVARLLGL